MSKRNLEITTSDESSVRAYGSADHEANDVFHVQLRGNDQWIPFGIEALRELRDTIDEVIAWWTNEY